MIRSIIESPRVLSRCLVESHRQAVEKDGPRVPRSGMLSLFMKAGAFPDIPPFGGDMTGQALGKYLFQRPAGPPRPNGLLETQGGGNFGKARRRGIDGRANTT